MNKFIQDNHSLSIQPGVLRGLHYQLNPKAQTKLVRVLSGAIYDVVVDLRRESPTFGQWEAVVLTEYNKHQLLVPKGFAHGFARSSLILKYFIKWMSITLQSMIEGFCGMIRTLGLIGQHHIPFFPTRIRFILSSNWQKSILNRRKSYETASHWWSRIHRK